MNSFFSMSGMRDEIIKSAPPVNKVNNIPENMRPSESQDVIYQGSSFEDFMKSTVINDAYSDLSKSTTKRTGYGSINPSGIKGIQDPSHPEIGQGYGYRGVREKISRITIPVMRECAHKVAVIRGIQNTRMMQLRPFSKISSHADDQGFTAKLKNHEATPDAKDKKNIEAINQFFLKCGKTDFPGWRERKYSDIERVIPMMSIEMMTIDQIALSFRRNKKGEVLDFHILDGGLIKPTAYKKGYDGDKSIKYVQEINGKVTETFKEKEILFYYNNPRADIVSYGFGYSYIEQCIDIITGWLYAMSYNKEVFNSNSMPKGFISFEEGKLDQGDLEELQRQWVTMFRGVKGMWRTPFLQHKAQWNSVAPNNRDMEWDKYTQWLSAWICAIHGMDPAEMGIRLNGAQNVLNENQHHKIAYSLDRGLKELVTFNAAWMNRVLCEFPEWEDYKIEFTGVEEKDQQADVDVAEKQSKVYRTINEIRKDHDLEPIDGGDIIDNQTYFQMKMSEQEAAGAEDGDFSDEDIDQSIDNVMDSQIEDSIDNVTKSDKATVKEYIEIEL